MDTLLKSLTQQSALILLVLTITTLGLMVWGGIATSSFMKSQKRFRELLQTPSGTDLETVLLEHTRERVKMQDEIKHLESRIVALETKMNKAKRHLGLVKYDAFEDVGGQQSFALAIYDDRGDGTVLSSIVGRADCRVFAKPIAGGKSERALSNEEQQAILDAATSAPKGFVSQ